MEPDEIWRLIETADNFLKFGDDPRAQERARARYRQALAEAEKVDIEALADQARRRLEDLDRGEAQ